MGKIKVSVHPLFFAFGLYFAFTGKVFSFISFTIVAVIHEIGHSFVAARLGYRLEKITLMPYGCIISGKTQSFSYKDEVKIAFAGPLVNLATVFVFFWALVGAAGNVSFHRACGVFEPCRRHNQPFAVFSARRRANIACDAFSKIKAQNGIENSKRLRACARRRVFGSFRVLLLFGRDEYFASVFLGVYVVRQRPRFRRVRLRPYFLLAYLCGAENPSRSAYHRRRRGR